MNKKHLASIICILLLIILVSACGGSNFPTGTFVTKDGPNQKWEFTDDGEFRFVRGGAVLNAGTYSVQSNEFTWETDRWCDNLGVGDATYTWTFENNILTFEVIGEDKCVERWGGLTGFIYYIDQ